MEGCLCPKFSSQRIALIELLVAVAVVAHRRRGLPSFMDGCCKSRTRGRSHQGLLTIRLKRKEYRITSAAYGTNPADAAVPQRLLQLRCLWEQHHNYTLQASASGLNRRHPVCAIAKALKDDTKGPLPEVLELEALNY